MASSEPLLEFIETARGAVKADEAEVLRLVVALRKASARLKYNRGVLEKAVEALWRKP
jgi:hypothetical protein